MAPGVGGHVVPDLGDPVAARARADARGYAIAGTSRIVATVALLAAGGDVVPADRQNLGNDLADAAVAAQTGRVGEHADVAGQPHLGAAGAVLGVGLAEEATGQFEMFTRHHVVHHPGR